MPDITRLAKTFTPAGYPATSDIQQIIGATTVRKYLFHFTGTFAQGALAGSPAPDTPFSLLRRFAYQPGGVPLRDADGRFWRWWNKMQNGFFQAPASVAPSLAPNASGAFSFDLTMDMEQPDLLAPVRSAFLFDTRGIDINMVFDWGSANDLDLNNVAGDAITATLVQITAVDEPQAIGRASRVQISKLQVVSGQIAASGTFDQTIPAKGPAYRGIALSVRAGNTDWNRAAGDDTVLAYVSLIGDNAIKFYDRVPYSAIQLENRKHYGFNDPGWILLDFAKDRTLGHLLYTLTQAGRVNDLVLRLEFASSLPANPTVLVYPINTILYFRSNPQAPAQSFPFTARR